MLAKTTPIKKRLLYLDAAKGLAIILVVWGHADLKMDPAFYEQYLKTIHRMVYSFHLPLFFMISAALMAVRIQRVDLNDKTFIRNLIYKILFPFFSLSLAFGIINVLTPQVFFQTPSIKEMLMAVFFMQSHVYFMPSGPLWFLFSLFSFALITYIWVKHLKFSKSLLLLVAVGLSLLWPRFRDNPVLGLNRFLYNYEFFVIGYIMFSAITSDKTKKTYLYLLALFVLWSLPFVFREFYAPFTHLITGVTGSLLVIDLFKRMDHGHPNIFTKFLYLCGENSILIFVFHSPVYVFVRKVVYALGLSNSFWGMLFMVAAGVVCPLLIGKLLSYNQVLYKFLFGRMPARLLTAKG